MTEIDLMKRQQDYDRIAASLGYGPGAGFSAHLEVMEILNDLDRRREMTWWPGHEEHS